MGISILIPARNEEFLQETIDDVRKHATGDVEILVALDNWDNPPEIKNADVVIKTAKGQRGATNELANLAKGKYVMKLDAHCSLSESFDGALVQDIEENSIIVPCLHNLHAYDWVCPKGHAHFQGKYDSCEQCGSTELTKKLVWEILPKPSMVSYYFDTSLHFQYCEEQSQDVICETMSLQGSCFMLSRERYFDLNICDEEFGSWGQQGTETACKMWLSGGKVLSTRNAFYGHQFRETEGFPYLNPVPKILEAQTFSRNLFLNNAWPRQVRGLEWLVRKFNYQGDWSEEKIAELIHSQLS